MIILGTNSIKETGFDVANSCRFNDDDAAYLHKTPSGAGNRQKFTLSCWLKKSSGGTEEILVAGASTSSYTRIGFEAGDELKLFGVASSSTAWEIQTSAKFRDFSAWYNFVFAFDTTQGTASDRIKIYVNGVRVTPSSGFGDETYPSQNYSTNINYTEKHRVGIQVNDSGGAYDGYMSEVVLIDNAQLDATSFGEFDDSGIWKPIDVSGLTAGTNGFYLDFEDSSNLGNDVFGGTDLTEVNLAATDQSTDTCTNNFCTMNPLNMPVSNKPTFSEGNLKTVTSSSGSGRFGGTSTFGVTQGLWYVEAKATVGSTYSRNSIGVSYNPAEMARNNSDNTLTDTSYAWGWDSSGGDVYHDSSVVVNYATYTTGDICQIFLDLDNHKLYYGKNGTLQSSTGISLDTGETYFIAQIDRTGGSDTSTFEFNFGSPIYAISSSNTDGKYGNFEYSTTITGDGASKTFKALNSANLAEYG